MKWIFLHRIWLTRRKLLPIDKELRQESIQEHREPCIEGSLSPSIWLITTFWTVLRRRVSFDIEGKNTIWLHKKTCVKKKR